MTVDANLVDTLALPSDALSVLSAPGVCTQLGLISESERDRLAAEPTYSVIAAAHDEEPILMGRLMISLDRVTEALRALNEDAVCRIAILRAAVDWQRAGVPKSLTPKTIEKLYRDGYWNEIGGGKRRSGASKSHFNHAMESLLAPWNDHGPQLLDEAYSGRAVHLRAHRLLTVVAEDPQHPPGWAVSDTLWNYLTKKLGHSDRLTVGLTAYNRGDYGAARKMLEVIDPMVIPAAVMLAVSLHAEYTGDVAAARNWYLKTVDSGDATVTGIAMVSLGALEQREGLLDDARGWYLRALDSGDPTTAGIAMVSLGGLAEEAGCLDDARGWYLRALDSGDPTMAGMAMLILGGLEYRLQRINDARRWYIKALGTHDLEVEPPALHQLGDLERGAGRVRIARRWYLKAIETDHPLEAPHALVHMGELEMEAGHISNARNWFVRAAESANPDVAAIAMYKLGEIGEETKNIEEACRWYHDAIDHGHPEIVPKAEHRLGHLEYKMGHFEIARQLFAAAAGSETDMASGCMIDSGHLEEELGNIAWARRWYLKAIKADDEFYGPHAMCDLGDLEEEAGRIRQARHWYRKAANAALPAAAGKAMCSLGRLEERIGHTEKARGWYLKAIEADHKCAQDALDQLQAKQDITQRVDNFMKYGHSYIDADHEGQASAAESPASVCGGDAAVTQILKTQMPRMRMQKVPTSEAAAGSVD